MPAKDLMIGDRSLFLSCFLALSGVMLYIHLLSSVFTVEHN